MQEERSEMLESADRGGEVGELGVAQVQHHQVGHRPKLTGIPRRRKERREWREEGEKGGREEGEGGERREGGREEGEGGDGRDGGERKKREGYGREVRDREGEEWKEGRKGGRGRRE